MIDRPLQTPEVATGDGPLVAFLGPAGTFTHAAAWELFGRRARYAEQPTIDDVFDAVRRETTGYGVVPIENSTGGSVAHAADALLEANGVVIQRELLLQVRQCLMSRAPALDAVTRVYSHTQALMQCRGWLATRLRGVQLVQAESTAAAAQRAVADAGSAAIGSALAAELYGLPVLRDDIQDRAENATRFALIATADGPPTGDDKTTVAFAVHDGRGALLRVLQVFDDHGINLTRIESRPSRQRAWDYVFLVDLEGHREDDDVGAALALLAERCPMLRILGSYPRMRTTMSMPDRPRPTS